MDLEGQFIRPPVFRKLRVFAVDPGNTARFETAVLNEETVQIPWEELRPGPDGEYLVVIDKDRAGEERNPPLDLDCPELLAQDGLPPSDGNPLFRQQMVYAVAMKTIRNFENALGRTAHWPPLRDGGHADPSYRQQLALYPHFEVVPTAYYVEDKGLCFGYFLGSSDSPLAGTLVFTCLSHDIIAHEITHALLSGMNLDFDPAGDDLALHEAFADLVALFQHFGDSDVLREQISAVRGELDEHPQLGAFALQMGQALGLPAGARNALGRLDEQGRWQPRQPDPQAFQTGEPHGRGAILVGAVFEAFKKIYGSRVADLRRIASRGTGILPAGRLHPDLINRLSREASALAQRVQHICIRALDYLPPIDVTFGDFLRALITGDYDLFPGDERCYRVAFIDAFRSYGIVPPALGLSADTLLWSPPSDQRQVSAVAGFVQTLSTQLTYWNLPRNRKELWEAREGWKQDLAACLTASSAAVGPIDVSQRFEVRSCDLRQRAGSAGTLSLQWVVKIVQEIGDKRSGCTLLVDAETGFVRYLIEKPSTGQRGDDLLARAGAGVVAAPGQRLLRVFAFDPTLGIELETAGINEVTLSIPWERDARGADALEPGPVGEYVEVVDHDPASGCFYAPVNLNHPSIIAQDGLPPSESNPQFHQQMVYAVTMRIIRDFERALGRLVLWSPYRSQRPGKDGQTTDVEEYVPRLRIHPHALREANAYYSPAKKALLFGYFPALSGPDGAGGPQLTVFTCLSHDIIAHEVTHALLDGIHRHFNEPSNPDVLAFHEAFADIVALFEHFSLPEVLRHQIAATRGDLASQNRLGELARQLGQAIGRRGALRSAIGTIDAETGRWAPTAPDPAAYQRATEPHERGAVLVAAVFDAFLTIYKARVADLLRIATEGTGVLPAGHLHPDLVNRLADEAARSARRLLDMCIRALDYCPPVDITFGDYLRAVITADFEYDPVDKAHDRVAFVEAFRRHGIVPQDIRALSQDGLLWRPASAAPDEDENVVVSLVKEWAVDIPSWDLTRDRRELFELMSDHRAALHRYLQEQMIVESRVLSGIDPARPFEVHSIRPSTGTDWHGRPKFQWVIELTQYVRQQVTVADEQAGAPLEFIFRGGCTLLVDAQTGQVRYSIKKWLDGTRLERQRRYVQQGSESLAATYFGGVTAEHREPFAMLHRL